MIVAALALSIALASPAPLVENVVAANGCSRWASEVTPPRTIRVRLDYWHIVRVAFPLYVARVTSSEWNTVRPQLRFAGAVAVKQYAWLKTLHPRHSVAGCFDVWGNTRDQIYRASKTPPAYVWASVRATWSWRVLRGGRLISTGYRTGRNVGCERDADSYHLFARSAAHCARLGWGARAILARYYEGRVSK